MYGEPIPRSEAWSLWFGVVTSAALLLSGTRIGKAKALVVPGNTWGRRRDRSCYVGSVWSLYLVATGYLSSGDAVSNISGRTWLHDMGTLHRVM